MSQNYGVAPPDPGTLVGQFRLTAGDAKYDELDPPEPGYGSYAIWSDSEVSSFLALVGQSVPRAIAVGYRQVAAATSAASIKTDDLTVSGDAEVKKWIALADYFDGIADRGDASAVDDHFELVSIGSGRNCRPEASPRLRGRGWC